MSALKTHLAASLLALMLALLASPPAAGAFGVKPHHDPLPADDGVLISSGDAAGVDDDTSPSGGDPEPGDYALCVQVPQLSLDASGRVDLARSFQGISPARHLRRGGHSPPRCPP
jgi:hypothetical protein